MNHPTRGLVLWNEVSDDWDRRLDQRPVATLPVCAYCLTTPVPVLPCPGAEEVMCGPCRQFWYPRGFGTPLLPVLLEIGRMRRELASSMSALHGEASSQAHWAGEIARDFRRRFGDGG